MSDVKERGLKG